MAYMLHRICSAIIKRESWLVKSPRKAGTLNPSCKRRFGHLTQGLVHGFVPQALMQSTFAFPPIITVFFITGEGFTRWSFRSLPICIILCIPRGRLRFEWCPSPPHTTQLLLQFIYLMLHVPLILCMGYVTFPTRLTSISVHGLPTLLMSSPLLRVDPRVIMLRTP